VYSTDDHDNVDHETVVEVSTSVIRSSLYNATDMLSVGVPVFAKKKVQDVILFRYPELGTVYLLAML
jgi:hypothetical protein